MRFRASPCSARATLRSRPTRASSRARTRPRTNSRTRESTSRRTRPPGCSCSTTARPPRPSPASRAALAHLPQQAPDHRLVGLVLLEVDQELAEGPRLRVAPVGADRPRRARGAGGSGRGAVLFSAPAVIGSAALLRPPGPIPFPSGRATARSPPLVTSRAGLPSTWVPLFDHASSLPRRSLGAKRTILLTVGSATRRRSTSGWPQYVPIASARSKSGRRTTE
jgi:hypothetical protein